MYVERDSRKQVLGKVENTGQLEYLSRCVELLVSTMIDAVPRLSSTFTSLSVDQSEFLNVASIIMSTSKSTIT